MSFRDQTIPCPTTVIQLVHADYAEDGSLIKKDGIELPILEFGNRETVTTYKSSAFTASERLRMSYDVGWPVDISYHMDFLNLQKQYKDEWQRFYSTYAGCPVWLKEPECHWKFGYIQNSGVPITTVRDKDQNCGRYELSFDFIEIPQENPPPVCTTRVYARYMQLGDEWTPPTAPEGSLGWVITYSLLTASPPTVTGSGDAPKIVIDTNTPGYGTPTADGCPIQVSVMYLCEESPLIPGVDFTSGTAQENFVNIAENTSNPSQLAVLDLILEALGMDSDCDIHDWNPIYTDFQQFLIDNPDFILDISDTGATDLNQINTLTNLKKLKASNNFLTNYTLDNLDNLALNYIVLDNNLFGMEAVKGLLPYLDTLKHIDMSHNQLQEIYLYNLDQDGVGGANTPNPFVTDYFNISYNFVPAGSNAGLRTKEFHFTWNIFPTTGATDGSDFWENTYGKNSFMNSIFAGYHFEIMEVLDLTGTALQYSFNAATVTNQPSTVIDQIITRMLADGRSLSEAKAIIIRDPKWENILEPPTYNQDDVLSGF
jgi:hypothetical protein